MLKVMSPYQRTWNKFRGFLRRYNKNRPAAISLVILVFFIFISIFASFIAPYDFYDVSRDLFLPPSRIHFLGTDNLGRDVFSGIVMGTRVSLFVGLVSASISAVVGIFLGAIAGYYGGLIDDVIMRFTELFLIIPVFFLILLVVSFFGQVIWNIMIIIGLTAWPSTARLVRAEFLSLKNREFVMAARAGGASDGRIMYKHILPNAIYPAIVNGSLQVASAIIVEAGLSFLGLGDPNRISWGQMLNRALYYVRSGWWMAFFPGIAIFITVIAFNLLGDGLNDALNPKLRAR